MGDGGSDDDGEGAGVERLAGLRGGVDAAFGDQRPGQPGRGDVGQQVQVGSVGFRALAAVAGQGGVDQVRPASAAATASAREPQSAITKAPGCTAVSLSPANTTNHDQTYAVFEQRWDIICRRPRAL